MSRGSLQRKSTLKKLLERDSSIGDRTTDDEVNHRRPCYQLIQRERQNNSLSKNDTQKINHQLNILREILFNQCDINDLMKRSGRSDKTVSKHDITRTGKNQSTKKIKDPPPPGNLHLLNVIDSNPSEEDNVSTHSADEEIIENEPVRESRSTRKDIKQHPMTRSSSLFSELHQQSNHGVRTLNSVSFISDRSKNEGKSNMNASSDKFRKLLDRLSFELNDLETRTGFKSSSNVLSSHTCSTALATALITLTGHVKQCVPNSKRNHEINHLKDQLSVVIKNQIEFQKKIENQMITLQTMMQTLCQLVNNEIITSKTYSRSNSISNSDKIDTNHAMNEILKLTRRMNNGTPIDIDLYQQHTTNSAQNHHSANCETSDASKKPPRPPSSMAKNEINANGIASTHTVQHKHNNQESRSSMISPIDIPPSYDMFELGLVNRTAPGSRSRSEIDGLGGNSSAVACTSINETLLEKILQERLRLVQQMSDLNKQHEMTKEELAHLEAKTH